MATRGCMSPYPWRTVRVSGSTTARFRGWAMVEMSLRAPSRGKMVSVSSVITKVMLARSVGSPSAMVNDVSVAPRSNRQNSVSAPRLRSHPIHVRSASLQVRPRTKSEKGCSPPCPYRSFRTAIPDRAASITVASAPACCSGPPRRSARIAKCTLASRFAR